ncbi:protein RMD5 homolog [Nymphaea colorata]|uniref:protein RMD5 homolog n=1 Tax=Nymphaea colorata TaxID=210225 RepID=UPI00129E965B|nr:protein RMD5 homolog [Nymphaea colorata]
MELNTNTIKDAFDRVAKKQKLSASKTQEVIDQVGHEIVQALENLNSTMTTDEGAGPAKSILADLNKRLTEVSPASQLEGSQKELNVALGKYGKVIEKAFIPDIAKSYRNVEFDMQIVNQIIATHFYRQGLFDLGDCFIDEAGAPDSSALKAPFLEMYQILEELKAKNLEPALKWVSVHHDRLCQTGSTLELKLHRLQFVEILKKGDRNEALKYARSYLAPFAAVHMCEIQKLMACLLWVGRLESSPYAELLSSPHWEEVSAELTQECCRLLGQSYESPLYVTIAAGTQGLPTLLKLANVMAAKKQEWQTMKQLPVPVDLGSEFQFHSIFVCPVSRDQGSEENPPMMLPCGHVLCKQSISKLSKSNTRIFKCPYCPVEANVGNCRQLYF